MARIDHTACAHPRTPAGRRACRAGNAAPVVTTPDPIAVYARTHHLSADAENGMRVAAAQVVTASIKMTGSPARKIARHAAKAEMVRPAKKTDLVVIATGSGTCIQAALHTFPGRCACGWATAGF